MEKTDQINPKPAKAVAHELQRMDVVRLVFFTFITFGLYHGVWYLKRISAFNSLHSSIKLTQGVFGFIIAGCVINAVLFFAVTFGQSAIPEHMVTSLADTSSWLNLAVWVVLFIQAFKTRRILIDHFDYHLKWDVTVSWFWTFLFTTFYLQYKIN
ncbi:unnamed protein product, partial [marine sediment metagenome]